MKNFKLRVILLALLLPASHYASAAWFSAKVLKIKMESPEHIIVEVDEFIQECGGSSNIIFRESYFNGGSNEKRRDMFNRVYSSLLSSFVTDSEMVFGTDNCEGPSMKGTAIHLSK